MTVDRHLAWAAQHPRRYEMCDKPVIAMSPEALGYIERKTAIRAVLRKGLRDNALPCFAV